MAGKQKAVLLINVGTPDAPDTDSVRRYLAQFLNDKRVLDMPWLFRKFLVNLIIVPFRAPKSARLYQRLWTPEGSPLLLNTEKFAARLRQQLDASYTVFTAMRYGNPSLKNALERIRRKGFNEIIVFPQFPQYASSTTGTILEFVKNEVESWTESPEIKNIGQFYNHPGFLEAFAENIASCHPETFDHIIFSYHGLPLRHIRKVHPGVSPEDCTCEKQMPEHGKYCYKATCYETTRLLAARLKLDKSRYSIAFQSRFSKNWLRPFTDKVIRELARKGAKRVLVAVPSFTADCLESLVEIGWENKELFKKEGGQELVLVKSLNASETWVQAAAELIRTASRP